MARKMRRCLPATSRRCAALVACCALAAGFGVAAAPVAPWAPLAGLSEPAALRLGHLRRARCLPDAAEVALPVYPRAVVIDLGWARTTPTCAPRDGWSSLGAVTLASGDDPLAVAAWYADRLDGYAQYRAAQGLLFIAAEIPDFLWERDYHKYPNVSITRASGEWDAAGYRTVIELNRPAPQEEDSP